MKRVWVNGCFDVLHRGHLSLFNYASTLGDKLTVGIDSDEKVAKDKGPDSPYNTLEDRVYHLNCLRFIDEVLTFDSREELDMLIWQYQPDFLVVGEDWKGKDVVGGEHAKKIVYYPRIKNYSTTNILNNDRE